MTGLPTLWVALRQAVALRLHWVVVLWAGWVVCATPLVRHATLGAQARSGADLVLTTGWGLTLVIAIAVGTVLTRARASDVLVIVRGISPARLLGSRAIAASVVCLLTAIACAVTYTGCAVVWRLPLSSAVVGWGLLLALESIVVMSLATLLGTLARPAIAVAATTALTWVGHLADETVALADAGATAVPALFIVLPDLDRFSLHSEVVHRAPVPITTVGIAVLLAVLWTTSLLATALWVQRARPVPDGLR